MAFDKTGLITSMREFMDPSYGGFDGFPASSSEFASKMAAAYDAAAASVQDVSTDTVATGSADPDAFEAALVDLGGSAADAAGQFGIAHTDYWDPASFDLFNLIAGTGSGGCNNSPAVAFVIENSSVTTTVSSSQLEADLEDEFGTLSTNATAKVSAIADALETAIQNEITVLITGQDSVPQTVTNTCGVT